jgi:RNA polymerase sigma-70 factor (ECF subfamily)
MIAGGHVTDPSHERALTQARSAWPELEIDADAFARHLHRHCPEGGDLDALAIEDLYLALGCALRDAKALQILHARLGPGIDRALSRLALDPDEVDDVREAIVHRLVVDDPPKIADYAGRGSLLQWLSAVAAREALTRKRTAARRRGLLDAAADDLAPGDPELHFLKSHYRAHFREAFADAVAALAPPDRTVLRHRFVDGLTLDQLARAAGVHRATAARSLARIRQELLESTRLGLHERLGVQAAEIDSVVRLIASNFEVSVQRLLRG